MNIAKVEKLIRVLGLLTALAYLIVILFIWVSANMAGYIYFTAGEPDLRVKYAEWLLGVVGIYTQVIELKEKLN